uniref:Immediate early response 2b n=1 Tax=Myripristis murdjan TaxID=586833 RepID=A0A667WI96_9TELE
MEVNAEARRILAVSISKLYASRTQRGGLRLHRSLLLSLVMRSARDIYHSSSRESEGQSGAQPAAEEPMDTSSSPGNHAGVSQAEPQPELISPEPAAEEPRSPEEPCESETIEDKENLSPARQSRKRRGKASVAPDFLPSKRARLDVFYVTVLYVCKCSCTCMCCDSNRNVTSYSKLLFCTFV